MEKRTLGNTGENISIIGFGGIIVMNETKKNSASFVSKAIERGINYFDVAPGYGNAQEMLGPALKKYRKNIFLACKIGNSGYLDVLPCMVKSARIVSYMTISAGSVCTNRFLPTFSFLNSTNQWITRDNRMVRGFIKGNEVVIFL